MSGGAGESDGAVSSRTTMQLSHKSIWDHARAVTSYWRSLGLWAVAVFGALWGLAEVPAHWLDIEVGGWKFYTAAVLISVAAGLGKGIHAYLNCCPKGLERESPGARRTAQLQRPFWEFHLARQLLEDKLRNLDNELSDLREGRVFVPIEKRLGAVDYVEWGMARPENMLRMLDVAKRLLITDFPASLKSTEDHPAEPASILHVVNQIRQLYEDTLAFERDNYAVALPAAFKSVEALQSGWSDPIRKAVRELFRFLDHVLSLGPKSDRHIDFTIEFEEPPNAESYGEEMERLISRLPEIIDDETML